MLHILWLIIKFILILLGAALGLLALVLLLALFCPVRYRAQAVKRAGDLKALEGSAGVSWLFHGISVLASYTAGETKVSVRVLGIPLERFRKKKVKEAETRDGDETPDAQEEPETQTDAGDGAEPEETAGGQTQKEEAEPDASESDAAELENEEEAVEPDAAPEDEPFTPEDFFDAEELSEEKPEKKGLFQRIREKLENIGLTIGSIRDKIEQWKKFLHHPRTEEALSLVWKHGKLLLKHIFPTKIEGDVTFGCENPAHTGQILAVLGISFPLHKNRIAVHPLFDGERVLEGNVKLKGRIYGIVPVWVFLKVYFNKNVKYVIRRVKRMRHKEG